MVARAIEVTRRLLCDWRVAAGAFAIALAVIAAPGGALAAASGCVLGEATGCTNCFNPPGMEECGCCLDSQGGPTCLYCRVE